MPTKNRRRFIFRALQMWRRQTHQDTELIIIEDGDDNVSDLISPDPRIRYFRHEGTLGAKLNFGASVARGSVLINWDDDDWNAPERIETQIDHMRISGKPFVGFSSLIFYVEGEDHGMQYEADCWYCSGSTHAYTKAYALANPRPDMTIGEDNVAVANAAKQHALSTISGTTCLVACNHDNNCTPKRRTPEMAQLWELLGPPDNFKQIPLDMFRRTITL